MLNLNILTVRKSHRFPDLWGVLFCDGCWRWFYKDGSGPVIYGDGFDD